MKYILILTLALSVFLSGCSHKRPKLDGHQIKTAKIIKEDDARAGILLLPDGKLSAIAPKSGVRFEPCRSKTQKENRENETLKECKFEGEKFKPIIEENIKYAVFQKNPYCVSFTTSSYTFELCSPPLGPYPEEDIKALLP